MRHSTEEIQENSRDIWDVVVVPHVEEHIQSALDDAPNLVAQCQEDPELLESLVEEALLYSALLPGVHIALERPCADMFEMLDINAEDIGEAIVLNTLHRVFETVRSAKHGVECLAIVAAAAGVFDFPVPYMEDGFFDYSAYYAKMVELKMTPMDIVEQVIEKLYEAA